MSTDIEITFPEDVTRTDIEIAFPEDVTLYGSISDATGQQGADGASFTPVSPLSLTNGELTVDLSGYQPLMSAITNAQISSLFS